MNDLLTPMIRELEEIARNHPDPAVRAEIMHLIDLMHGTCDQNLLEIMHQFYHLREQVREEQAIDRLLKDVQEAPQMLPFVPDPADADADLYPQYSSSVWDDPYAYPHTGSSIFKSDQFQDVIDEIEVREMMQAHRRWKVTIGEA